MITLEKPITKQKAQSIINRMLWSYGTGTKEEKKTNSYRAMLMAVKTNWRPR